MTTQIQLRRGTTAEVNAMTPAIGEPVVDTTLSEISIGDGSTAGGIRAQKKDAELSAIAGLASAADSAPYFTGAGTAALMTVTTAARTVLDDTTVSAMVDTLGGAAATGTGGIVRTGTPTITTPVLTGLPTGSGVSATATVSTLASRDSSGNSGFNNALEGYTTTVTAAGTTTLTVGSTADQYFTGSTTQTVTLPVASTLTLGHTFNIDNSSTGAVTINSSGGNAVLILAAGTSAMVSCILTSGTSAASWKATYLADIVTTAKKLTVTNTLTLSGTDATTMTFPTTSATIARTDAANTFTGTQTMGAASFSTTSGIIGTTTNNNAAALSVGEIITSTVLVASQVSLTTNTSANVTSISLTAGDWDVQGNVVFNAAGTTTTSFILAWVSQTSATPPTLPAGGASQLTLTFATGQVSALPTGTLRFSLSGTTTVYLEAFATFSVSTMGAYGVIRARRIR